MTRKQQQDAWVFGTCVVLSLVMFGFWRPEWVWPTVSYLGMSAMFSLLVWIVLATPLNWIYARLLGTSK